jgi:hypothetical protein
MIDKSDNKTVVDKCCKCKYLRECRVVLKCGHPYGLKQPTYDSYCSYGEQKEEEVYEDKTY